MKKWKIEARNVVIFVLLVVVSEDGTDRTYNSD